MGQVTEIDTISVSTNYDKTSYYHIKNYDIDSSLIKQSQSVYRSGKRNEQTNLDIFFTVPMVYKSGKKPPFKYYKFWICEKFNTNERSSESQTVISRNFNHFKREATKTFYTQGKSEYFKRLNYSNQKIKAIYEIEKMHPYYNSDEVFILEPISRNPRDMISKSFKWVVISFFTGIIFFILILIKPRLKPYRKPKYETIVFLYRLIKPKRGCFISPILLCLYIIIFTISVSIDSRVMQPTGDLLIDFGAAGYHNIIYNYEIWRVATAIFIQENIFHLILNIINLIILGKIVEAHLKREDYIMIYITSGVITIIASLIWDTYAIVTGTSGAIFGLWGAYIMHLYNNNKSNIDFYFYLVLVPCVTSCIVIGFFVSSLTVGIGNIVGLISGATLYYLIKIEKFNDTSRTVLWPHYKNFQN
ncbi:MAG: hypothetical protein BM557_07585 [Flavobacterium sp. MedPE-SWcel]|uniref:rhomboid family intramembrane serine protease n=1 Tax=uncultured Flavobacterium sp. TaxID=165435 RepID=UPI00091C34BA|nr:rhomboid family intramembrane serine protease [uncultured Flavobacterium sp.]OIQ18069.1 MAG: hypothetical protein BM557_07585 [Flavobacterium sp. MedPE-SWcel]